MFFICGFTGYLFITALKEYFSQKIKVTHNLLGRMTGLVTVGLWEINVILILIGLKELIK